MPSRFWVHFLRYHLLNNSSVQRAVQVAITQRWVRYVLAPWKFHLSVRFGFRYHSCGMWIVTSSGLDVPACGTAVIQH